MYLKELNIGNVKIENNIFLAPMAGITDSSFRKICKEYGPGLVFTEMASSKAIYYKDDKTNNIMDISGEKKPIAVQIFGSDVESMGYAAKQVSNFANIIDINMGCPAPKVVKNGDGSRLLLDLNKASEVIKNVVKQSKVPVTVKFRKGWDKDNIVAVECAQMLENSGVSMITIHGRTREEYYSGKADLEIIKKVKEKVKIPVIGNGDITDEESALKMFEYTGVDGIMIGRASIGNPWIFEKIIHYLKTGEKLEDISNKEKLHVIQKHLELIVNEKGEKTGVNEIKKHLACYVKNMENATNIRQAINISNTKNEVLQILKEMIKI